jgi:hypothetical protein
MHYPFDGNANDIIRNHNASVQGPELAPDRFGQENHCYRFNREEEDYMEVYHEDFTPGTQARSISLWFATDSGDHIRGHLVEWYRCGATSACSSVDAAHYMIYLGDSGSIIFWNRGDDKSDSILVLRSYLNDGQWHHVVSCFDPGNGQHRIYIDNQLIDSFTLPLGTISNGGINVPFSIGRRYQVANQGGPLHYFSGFMDDVRIYDRILSAADVDSLFSEPNPKAGISNYTTSLKVFPNPVSEIIHFSLSGTEAHLLSLYSLDGSLILQKQLFAGEQTLDVGELRPGIYYCYLRDDKGRLYVCRIMKY